MKLKDFVIPAIPVVFMALATDRLRSNKVVYHHGILLLVIGDLQNQKCFGRGCHLVLRRVVSGARGPGFSSRSRPNVFSIAPVV